MNTNVMKTMILDFSKKDFEKSSKGNPRPWKLSSGYSAGSGTVWRMVNNQIGIRFFKEESLPCLIKGCDEEDLKKFLEDLKKIKDNEYDIIEVKNYGTKKYDITEVDDHGIFDFDGIYYNWNNVRRAYFTYFQSKLDNVTLDCTRISRHIIQLIKKIEIKNHDYFEDIEELNFKKINFLIGDNKVGKTLFFHSLMNNVRFKDSSQKTESDKNIFSINGVKNKYFYSPYKTFAFFPANKSLDQDLRSNSMNPTEYPQDTIPYNLVTFVHGDKEEYTYSLKVPPIFKLILDTIKFHIGTPSHQVEIEKTGDRTSYTYPSYFEKIMKFMDSYGVFSTKYREEVLNNFRLYHEHSQIKYTGIENESFKENVYTCPLSSFEGYLLTLIINIHAVTHERDIILLEEPETHVHPSAQLKLIEDVFKELKNQVIISTHSPYILKNFIGKEDVGIFIFKKLENGKVSIQDINKNSFLKDKGGVSFGETNYLAYDLPTEEFHNELYGFIQASTIDENNGNYQVRCFDNYLKNNGFEKDKKWISPLTKNKSEYEVTKQTYIRHFIHHPENICNEKYSDEELRNSIDEMFDFLKKKENEP